MKGWCIVAALMGASLAGCGAASEQSGQTTARRSRPVQPSGDATAAASSSGRCDASAPNHEVSEYDTSGDERPDVRKVFLQVGRAPLIRLVLICREADLNGDGTKDIVRYYNDEGRPLREEADRNFDGQMDETAFFESGRVARSEADTNADGKVDTKTFYERGQPIRAERDMVGRSTAERWQPDRWEYFEEGRMVRMGADMNGDGVVDRWDRDASTRPTIGSTREADNAAAGAEGGEAAGSGAGTAPANANASAADGGTG
jgi:hypothetical protein